MASNFPGLQSFIKDSDQSLFSIHNLPYGVFQLASNEFPHIGVAIGTYILDLTILEDNGRLNIGLNKTLFKDSTLNNFAECGQKIWAQIRTKIQNLLHINNPELQNNSALLEQVLIPQTQAKMLLPFKTEGFSDFYASENHATNVGKLFRGKENALLPNWKYLPVAYNGRASTVFISGTAIKRPHGQIKIPTQDAPIFGPTKKLDFELEIGIFIGVGNPDGQAIHVNQANSHIFGLVLLNDWSARDIQAFEYQPLGPFLAKSFATSISPWVVPWAALQNCNALMPNQIPTVVEYLQQPQRYIPDITLKVEIEPINSKQRTTLCTTSTKELYWSLEQMIAHHTVNNCILKSGDLFGSGTISGPNRESWGSLLEISLNGAQPVILNDQNERQFLEDGDLIIMSGYCKTNHCNIGFGSVEGRITI